ncbi:MAG: hypothetical protein AB7J28_01945 [Hyphomonadaceae bacterium]
MQTMKTRILALAGAFAFCAAAAACGQGPAEQAGERADSAYENATQGYADPADGPLENTGEKLDDMGVSAGAVATEAQEGAAAAETAVTEPPAQ